MTLCVISFLVYSCILYEIRGRAVTNVVRTSSPTPLLKRQLNMFKLFLQVTNTAIKSWMGSIFGQNRPRTAEIAAFERVEKSP